MAAIVKANPSLTAGGLAVLRRQYSTTDDGTLNYEAEYVCLSQFANNHIGKFRTGAQPPTPIPASMSLLRLDKTPTLYDFQTRTENGLTYFNGRYTAASSDAGEVITTETQEQRSFSGTVLAEIRTAGNLGSTSTVQASVPISFDYISITRRVEAKNPRSLPEVRGDVGVSFNFRIADINGVRPQIVSSQISKTTLETSSTTRSSRGTYTYSKSSSGVYSASGPIA